MVALRFSCLVADVHRWEINVFRVAERSREEKWTPGLSSEACLGPYMHLLEKQPRRSCREMRLAVAKNLANDFHSLRNGLQTRTAVWAVLLSLSRLAIVGVLRPIPIPSLYPLVPPRDDSQPGGMLEHQDPYVPGPQHESVL